MKFADLSSIHRDLERLFLRHQLALVDRDMVEADASISRFASLLARHVHDEDRFVFPAYFLVSKPARGADRGALAAEHAKLDAMLQTVLSDLSAAGARPSAIQLLVILEHEHRLKSLLEHHFLREENVVFPAIDAHIDPAERERLLASCLLAAGEALAKTSH